MTITQEMQDVKPYYFKIYEVHGMFPVSNLTKILKPISKVMKIDTRQQMHCSRIHELKLTGSIILLIVQSKEAEDPYRCDSCLKKTDERLASLCRTFSSRRNGWWITAWRRRRTSLTSAQIVDRLQTIIVGLNILSPVETGTILNHKINEPLTAAPLVAGTKIEELTAFGDAWKAIAWKQRRNRCYDRLRPSQGTSWRMQNLQLQEAQALFDTMKENKGLALEDMLREWSFPTSRRSSKTINRLWLLLNHMMLKKIDSIYVPQEAIRRYNRKLIKHVCLRTASVDESW